MPSTIGKGLPEVSPTEAAMACTALGGVVMNFVLFHLQHFPAERRPDRLNPAFAAARDAVGAAKFVRGTYDEQANAKSLVLAILAQAEGIARDKLLS